MNIGNLLISPMNQEDVRAVALLELAIFSDAWPESAFLDILSDPNKYSLVARSDGNTVAYAIYFIEFGEAHLANIAVDPNFRGKSIAKKLLNCIFEAVKDAECENIFLDVRQSNLSAINLYEQFGFMEIYIRENYYNSPIENAVVMVKNFREDSK